MKILRDIFFVGLFLVVTSSLFIFLTLPKSEDIIGKCFYHKSLFEDLKNGKSAFFVVTDKDIWRFHVTYFEMTIFDTFVVTNISQFQKGTLPFSFINSGDYSPFKACPKLEENLKDIL